jgi:hypothetical protein
VKLFQIQVRMAKPYSRTLSSRAASFFSRPIRDPSIARQTMKAAGTLALALCLIGCAAEQAQDSDAGSALNGPGSLVDHLSWSPLEAAEDPFAEHRPESVVCPEWARELEGEVYEIQTDDCNYASLTQPSLLPLRAGERIDVVYWHLRLWAPEMAQAHVALTIGDWTVFEEHIEVPGAEGSYSPQVIVPHDIEIGAPITFHLHNHGSNSWRLLSIDRAQP